MDDNIKQTLPSKNKEDDLAHELDYTKDLLKLITSDASLSEVPAKQRLNMLKETCFSDIEDHHTTSKMQMPPHWS